MFFLKAKIRKECGKSANRRLRATNKFPAIIYGGNSSPIAIELDHNKVWAIQSKLEFYNEILTIIFEDKKEENVKIQAIQRCAYKPRLSHIDFIRV